MLFNNPHEITKKDAHPDLTGIFPVAPALADGVIFTSHPKVDLFHITIDICLLKTFTNFKNKSENLTKNYCELNNLTKLLAVFNIYSVYYCHFSITP